jgi:hypothetical protein
MLSSSFGGWSVLRAHPDPLGTGSVLLPGAAFSAAVEHARCIEGAWKSILSFSVRFTLNDVFLKQQSSKCQRSVARKKKNSTPELWRQTVHSETMMNGSREVKP